MEKRNRQRSWIEIEADASAGRRPQIFQEFAARKIAGQAAGQGGSSDRRSSRLSALGQKATAEGAPGAPGPPRQDALVVPQSARLASRVALTV
jgi:hypothetical protein